MVKASQHTITESMFLEQHRLRFMPSSKHQQQTWPEKTVTLVFQGHCALGDILQNTDS